MEKSSIFGSVGGDRKYKAEDWAEYFSSFIGNGVFPNPSTNLMVVANGDMTVTLKAGKAWINGYFYYNTDDLTISINTADGVLNRIDRIVIRLDYLNREIKAYCESSDIASSPIAHVIQRDADIYELAVADIAVGNGVVEITQNMITDLRLDTELCGLVTQTVQTIDTSELAAQLQAWFSTYQSQSNQEYQILLAYFESLKIQSNNDYIDLQAWFANYKINSNTAFNTWLQGLQDTLDENAETNILNLISANTARADMLESVIFNDISTNPYLIQFDDLNDVEVGGVWNLALQRIEC